MVRPFVRSRLMIAIVGAILLLAAFKPVYATASYHGSIRGELEINPRDPYLNVGYPRHSVYDRPPDPAEGVTFLPGGYVYGIDIAQTMFYQAECAGVASWPGTGDVTIASGVCAASGGFELANGRAEPVDVEAHVTIDGCLVQGSVDNDVAEAAGTEVLVNLEVSDGIEGAPDNPIFIFGRNTRDEGVDTHFDITCLPVDLRIPLRIPGGEDGAVPGEFILRFVSINLRFVITGQAGSILSSSGASKPLTFVPDPPKDPDPSLKLKDRINDLSNFFEDAVKLHLIEGAGGSSKNLQEYRKLLDLFYTSWSKAQTLDACGWLLISQLQSDGAKFPPDLIQGPMIGFLNRKLRDLAENGLRCPVGRTKSTVKNFLSSP